MKSSGQDTAVAGRVTIEFLGTTMEIPLIEIVPPARGPAPESSVMLRKTISRTFSRVSQL